MKKLIAAAVAAAVIAPMTAVAAGPTLYGKIHMSVGYYDDDTRGGYSSVNFASNSSRIGVKGSEDLGNGLKIGYLMEWSVGMDGGSDLGQRNRGITIGGGFGTLVAGRWDSPMKSLGRKADMFGERSGDIRALTRAASLIDDRHNNVLGYFTPVMSGVQGKFVYVTDVTGATGDDTDFDAFSGTVEYSNGPLYLGVGYTAVMSDSIPEEEKDYRFVGKYKTGAFDIRGSYTDINDGNGIDKNDYGVWSLALGYSMGNNTIKAQVSDKSEGVSGSDDEATNWVIGVDHKMSKRTMAYIEYGQLNNDDGSSRNSYQRTGSGVNMPAPGAGDDPSGFAVGIVHKF